MTARSYAFGRFTIEPRRQLLRDGRPVRIGGRALDLLSILAEAEGALVTKDELMARVWDGLVVEENAIQVHLSAARKLLAEEAGRLVTVRGRGYRLVLDPSPAAAAAPTALAVLPFANLTGDPGLDYLADAIAEELITTLSRAEGLHVAARTSSFAYRGRATDIRTIARDLGAGAIVEGSLRVAGDRIRVTAQLIEASSGFHVWAQNFDRQGDDLLHVQDDLAASIAGLLTARLAPPAPARPDPMAQRLYLEARGLSGQLTPPALLRAIALHEQAIAVDPGFARPHAALAGTLLTAAGSGVISLSRLDEARSRIGEAIRLDRGHGASHAILALLDAIAGRWREAEAGFARARALDCREPVMLTSMAVSLFAPTERIDEAVEAAGEAVMLAPAVANFRMDLAGLALTAGDAGLAEASLEMAALLGIPETRPRMLLLRSELAAARGEGEAARRLAVEAAGAAFPDEPEIAVAVALAQDGLRAPASGRAAVDAMLAVAAARDGDHRFWRRFGLTGSFLAWLFRLGGVEPALVLAERAVAATAAFGVVPGDLLEALSRAELAPLRRDARFDRLAERCGAGFRQSSSGPSHGGAGSVVASLPTQTTLGSNGGGAGGMLAG